MTRSRRLTRRELLASILGANAAALALAACDERDGEGEDELAARTRDIDGEILGPRMDLGHALRDRGPTMGIDFDGVPARELDAIVLGGGPAGLSAGWQLLRRGVERFELAELEPVLGGTSRDGASDLTRYPWGAHYLPVPLAHDTLLVALLREMGAVVGVGDDGAPVAAEELLVREPDERLFHQGFWYRGLYLAAGASHEDRRQRAQFAQTVDAFVARRCDDGRRAFTIPAPESSRDAALVRLDRMSAREWLDREGFDSTRLRWLVEYGCRDDYGLSLETTSAWAALFYHAARQSTPGVEASAFMTWPEGNGALARHLASRIGDRARPSRLVVDVAEIGERVRVRMVDAETRRPDVVVAKRVVCALPRFVARRVVAPLRDRALDDDEGFRYGAWLVANLHLRSRPASRGFPFAWDNVLYDSPSLGYVVATHQRGRDFGPTVWTYYLPFVDEDPRVGREKLLAPSFAEWRDVIVADLSRAHPDLARHVARIDVFRWGHGMIQPRPGFVWSDARERARAPLGRVHFAHSDLAGIALFEHAFHEGVRAADEVADALAPAEVAG